MSRMCRMVVVVLGLVALVGQASAQFDRTSLLINVPTTQVLPGGTLAGSLGGTFPMPLSRPNRNPAWEWGGALRFAPVNRLELALTAYTLEDIVLGATYQVYGGPGRAGLALGIHDIGLHKYVSPIGHGEDDAWPDWKYKDENGKTIRTSERFSAFAVSSHPIANIARVHVGLGRGRYVGRDRGKNLNTDMLFDGYNDWAIGLFGGMEFYPVRFMSVGLEFDGRDVNVGLKTKAGPVVVGLAATKMEGLTAGRASERFGRIALAAEYQLNLRRERKPVVVEPEPVVVAPAPEPEPEPGITLEPIYFAFDRSEIRPGDAEILRRNAGVMKSQVEAGNNPRVTIEGHCCPLGTAAYNMALGMRRAESTRRYLVNLGADNGMLSTISYGEERLVTTNPAEYHRNRRSEFRMEFAK